MPIARPLVLASVVGVGAAISLLTISAWPLALVTLALTVAAWSTRCGWWLAPACTSLTLLPLIGLVWPILVVTGASLPVSTFVLGVAVAAVAITVLTRSVLPAPSRSGLWTAAAAAAVPAVALGVVAVARAEGRGATWPLVRDGLIRVFDARRIIEDGGFDHSTNHVQDPLTPEIISIFMAPGHSGTAAADLLRFEADRQGWVVLAILGWCSIVIAAAVASAVPARFPVVRAVLALGAGALPWTWYIGGIVLVYGFTNAAVALIVLVSVWTVWLRVDDDPVVLSLLLIVGTFAAGVAWAPAALVPAALAVLAARRHRSALRRAGRRAVAGWVAVGLACALYLVFVTFGGISGGAARSGDGLAVDGEFVRYSALAAAAVPLGAAVACLAARRTPDGRQGWIGSMAILGSGGLAVAYLAAQRVQADSSAWGYYPQKLAWILSMAALVVGARALVSVFTSTLAGRRDAVMVPMVVGLIVVAGMMSASPWTLRVVPTAWDGAGVYLTWASLTDADERRNGYTLNILDRHAEVVSAVAAPGRRVLLVDAIDDPPMERYINFVVLKQQEYTDGRSDLAPRPGGDLTDLEQLCRYLDRWDSVEIVTTDRGLEERVEEQCPGTGARVIRR